MIIPEKVRNMSEAEKMGYYLNQLTSDASTENQKHDAITVISDLMKGVPLDQLSEKFNLKLNFDFKTSPATVTIIVPNTENQITMDLNVTDRNQFDEANPEKETRPIKSILTEEEQKELLSQVNGPAVIK